MMRNILKRGTLAALVLSLAFTTFVPASFAATPKLQDVEYKGNGRVEVEFRTDVRYRDCKVSVTDKDGNSYDTVIIERDDDEMEFKVKNFKAGKQYTFKIKGVKKVRTADFGTVTGKFFIKKTIGKKEARNVALNHFMNKFNLTRADIEEVDADYESRRNRYEVSVETWDGLEYEYYINAKTGKILKYFRD